MVGDDMVKIQQGNKCLFVNLPIEYCRLLGWGKGQELAVYPAPNEPRALIIKEMSKFKKQFAEP